MHGANRAVILAFIEQRRINSGWRAILEAFFVQTRQYRLAFRRAQCACRRRPRRSHRRRSLTAIPVVRSARHPQSLTSRASAHVDRQFADRGHQDLSSGSTSGIGFPNSAATFFCTSMMISALRSFSVNWPSCRRSFWFSSARGLRSDRGPRWRGFRASWMPAWRSRRQLVRCEEYNPSRRSSAPTPPGVVEAASASSRIRILYSMGNVRRFAWATTSESGRDEEPGKAPALAAAALRCGSPGGEPSLRSAAAKPPEERTTPREFPFISAFFFLALLIN